MDAQLNMFPDDDILRAASPRLIAFAGRAGSGKSAASESLMYRGWERVKFASPLKNMLRAYYDTLGLEPKEVERRIEGDLKEEPDPYLTGRSPRHAMQTLGGEWGRGLMRDSFWVRGWTQAVINLMQMGANVVVDDCRYPNEAEAIRKLGGRIVMIVRPDAELVDVSHESERFDFEPDLCIQNDGSVFDLVTKVHELTI